MSNRVGGVGDGQQAGAAAGGGGPRGPQAVGAGAGLPASAGASGSRPVGVGAAAAGLAIGLIGGAFGGLAGLGGGAVMVPMMTAFLGFTQHQAHGSSLLAVLFTALSGGITYFRLGAVDLVAAVAIAVSAMISARVGAQASHRVAAKRLRRYFGLFLMTVAVVLPVSRYLMAHVDTGAAVAPAVAAAGGLVIGVFSGFLAGILGVGGGALVVPALVIGMGYPQHLAQGTSLVQMIPTAISGTATHHSLGHIRWDIAPWMGIGAIGGGWLGSVIAGLLPSAALRYVFALVAFLLGLNYMRSSSRSSSKAEARASQ